MDERSAFEILKPQLQEPEYGIEGAVRLYIACLFDQVALATSKTWQLAHKKAEAEILSFTQDRSEAKLDAKLQDFFWEERLLKHLNSRARVDSGASSFPAFEHYVKLTKYFSAAWKDFVSAAFRKQITLIGNPDSHAHSSERQPIPHSFFFESKNRIRRIILDYPLRGYDYDILECSQVPYSGERWDDVRISGTDLLKLIAKHSLISDEPLADRCRTILISTMSQQPRRGRYTKEILWNETKAAIPELDLKTFEEERRDLTRKGAQFESWGKGGAPTKKKSPPESPSN